MSDQVFGFGCTSRTIKHPARYPESIKIYISNELNSLMYTRLHTTHTTPLGGRDFHKWPLGTVLDEITGRHIQILVGGDLEAAVG